MTNFDANAKEAALRAESEAWDTSSPVDASPGDIPVIDISDYLASPSAKTLTPIASALGDACETVGFWQLVGHGISSEQIGEAFDAVRRFHALPVEVKQQIRMDRPEWPLGGVGYLPVGNRKLPARATGNQNEAFLMKGDRDIDSDDNQWLDENSLPGFRSTVESFGARLEQLAIDLLPLYATALGLDAGWFAPGFEHPFWRLRMTRYPAASSSALPAETSGNPTDRDISSSALPAETPGNPTDRDISSSASPADRYGINPHVDTTFFTLLLQDSPGLTIYHTPSDRWLNVPLVPDAFVVNSGELLRQWTNDRFLSVRHFANAGSTSANTNGDADRYSIPFFVNATRDYVMECVPTCCDPDNPSKYPPISYDSSQGVIQGE